MSVVDSVLSLGDDSLSNQFKVIFPNGIPGGGNADAISMRMDQSIDIPQQTIYKYDIDFRGSKISKTGKKEETDKVLTMSVRIDQQWTVYDDMKLWFSMVYDPITNVALPDLLTRTTMVIQSLDGANAIAKSFKFNNVKITDMKVTTFDNSSGDPLRMELTFLYGTMES